MKRVAGDDFDTRPIPEDQRILHIDVTFDDSGSNASKLTPNMYASNSYQQKTHLGLQSCAIVKLYTAEYPYLRDVGILLKKFLGNHDLSCTYYGNLLDLLSK